MNTNFRSLPLIALLMGLRRLEEAGVTPERWVRMLCSDHAAMERLAAAWPGETVTPQGTVYEAAAVSSILGLPVECSDAPPQAADGEIVVYYGGWDLRTLRACPAGKQRMWQEYFGEEYGWTAEPGYYRLLLPVPGCKNLDFCAQLRHLASIYPGWAPAPVCVAATALLVHLAETGNDLLRDEWCPCAEVSPDGFRAVVWIENGCVRVKYWLDDHRKHAVWLSAAQKA